MVRFAMDEDKMGLDLEAITKRLKAEFAPSDKPLPEEMQTLLDRLKAGTRPAPRGS
jgi:hypothetical protein